MTYTEIWQRVWEYGQGKVSGDFITVTETVEPIIKEMDRLKAQIEELEYQLRMAKEMR